MFPERVCRLLYLWLSAISVLRRELAQETPAEPNVIVHHLNQALGDDLISNNCKFADCRLLGWLMILSANSGISRSAVSATGKTLRQSKFLSLYVARAVSD